MSAETLAQSARAYPDEDVNRVIDFDNAYEGPLLLDLEKTMAWFDTHGKKFSVEDALEVHRGYLQQRPLNDEETEHLYAALKFAFLSHVFLVMSSSIIICLL